MDGFMLCDLDGRLLEVNEAYCRMSGYSEAELLGMKISQLEDAETANDTANHIQTIIRHGADRFESRHRRKDGGVFYVEVSVQYLPGVGGQCVAFLHDITRRRHSEQALLESKSLLSLFMQHSPIYAYIKDVTATESRVLHVSDNYMRMLGIPVQDIVGKTMADLFPSELAASMTSDDQKVVASGQLLEVEEELNGRSYVSIKFPIALGGKTLLAGYTIDITERKQAEAERARLESQLRQAAKMESVGRLAGGVAHDFNNMLGVILGHVEMALEQTDVPVQIREDLLEIRKAAQHSAELTRQLLAFGRKQTFLPKVLDLNDTVAGMLKMMRRLIGEDIELSWEPGAQLWPVRMDPVQIDQILANLCVNARHAITGHGKVTLVTGNVTLDAQACADKEGLSPGDYAWIDMIDTGCGMDKETLAHVFEPFFTTKEMGKGTGLGLATVYGIAKQNNGFVDVHSVPGEGTTFRIYLPRCRESVEKGRIQEPSVPSAGVDETILLVEDEPAMLRLTQAKLEKQGYTVLAADCPAEAVLLASQYDRPIDLLVTDVVMPGMNGWTLANELLAKYPHLRFVFMSGYPTDHFSHAGIIDETVHFIQKPFSSQALMELVRKALDEPFCPGQFLPPLDSNRC